MRRILRLFSRNVFNLLLPLFLLRFRNTRRPRLTKRFARSRRAAHSFLRSESHRALIARILAGRIISRHQSIFLMTRFQVLIPISMIFSGAALAQTPAPTASATASDVAALRDQVQALTETVKQLQQQVKDQQTLLEKANLAGNQPQAEVAASPSASPSPGENAPFPTTDTSVVAAAPTPGVSANGTSAAGGFPTTDESVVASTSTATTTAENPPITAATSSLTQPITIGGGKTYMNISLDSVFALAVFQRRQSP